MKEENRSPHTGREAEGRLDRDVGRWHRHNLLTCDVSAQSPTSRVSGTVERNMMAGSDENIPDGPRRVLLASHSSQESSAIAKALEHIGCRVYVSSPGKIEELEQLLDLLGPAILILLDSFGHDQISLYQRVKTPPHRALLPIIAVCNSPEDRLNMLRAGIDAVILAPESTEEVQAIVNGIVERVTVMNQHKELDDLTAAYTATACQERLDYEVGRARRYRRHGCLTLIDLDNYEKVREAVGELAADAGLRRFCQIVRHELRETDMIGRLAGDRFAVVMPDTDLTGAIQAMRRVLAVIGCATVEVPGGQKVTLAASAGVGPFGTDSPETLMRRVGNAIERAKTAGGGALFTA